MGEDMNATAAPRENVSLVTHEDDRRRSTTLTDHTQLSK